MIVRKAVEADALDIWAWRNDPHTRAMSRTQDFLEQEAHLEWFSRALRDANLTLLIGEDGNQKVGTVRFDHGDETEVSININPLCRSQGLGYALLEEAMRQIDGNIRAEVREDNFASQRLFERAGFELQGVDAGFRRYCRYANRSAAAS